MSLADAAERRQRALDEIAVLARTHDLTAAEILEALGEPATARVDDHRRRVLVRVLGVLGGTFVFAGVAAFIGVNWSSMTSAARVIVTLGSGLSAFLLSRLADRDARFVAAATPLLLASAVLQPTGLFVLFDEYGTGGDWRWANLITTGVMAVQMTLTHLATRHTAPLFFVILFTTLAAWTTFDLLDVDGTAIAIVIGASLLLATIGLGRTVHRGLTPLWYAVGAVTFLSGLFDAVERSPMELLFLVVAAGFVYLSTVLQSRTLLAVATLAILAYTAWYTAEYFADSVGWPLALIAFGLVMIASSALALRLGQRIGRARAE